MNNEQTIGDYTIAHNKNTVVIKVHPRVLKTYSYYSIVGAIGLNLFVITIFILGSIFADKGVDAKTWETVMIFVKYVTPAMFILILLGLTTTYYLNRKIFIHFDSNVILIKSNINSLKPIDKRYPFKIEAAEVTFKRPAIFILREKGIPEIVNLLYDIKKLSDAEDIVEHLKKIPGLLN
ncbi:MAG: hypothetical protein R2800_08705 [Flavipsychrobacter sp.]